MRLSELLSENQTQQIETAKITRPNQCPESIHKEHPPETTKHNEVLPHFPKASPHKLNIAKKLRDRQVITYQEYLQQLYDLYAK